MKIEIIFTQEDMLIIISEVQLRFCLKHYLGKHLIVQYLNTHFHLLIPMGMLAYLFTLYVYFSSD